ncbi:hypothetical protein EWE74_08965 [Sphingobacterium corticibacterium]|uniref:Uncharacterized protein n=1 Tax=Sphingobacterium corticibacterium TaxID=2484746 RepID=A0A4Q6XVI1_9SPHI|nr:hypothetical protein EWE74_08965 [Sphingobacterium corticibacterium]
MRNKAIKVLMVTLGLSTATMAQEKLYQHTFGLGDVKLLESPFLHAQNLNVETLLAYDVDRLLAPFLKEAGLEPKAPSFSNWIDLDGHVGGHYLSALAIHYASTGDERCKERMDYMLAELKRCQEKNGDGYLGGVPNGENLWKEVKKGNVGEVWKYWVPWYNLHKTYAGLRDAWLYGHNEEAKAMFIKLSDWGTDMVAGLSDEQMESMLANEFGGMNEVYADAYQITGDARYLITAKRFSHKQIFDSVSHRVDNLDNMHANTQVPKAVGYQRVAELTHEQDYMVAADFFWETVSQNRSLALGGNSRREHFPSEQDFLNYMEEREGPESCNTNNMLKLAGGLFRMKPDAKYMDFYERALYNHILSTQHPDHGGYVYFTSARPAHYRVYSKVNSAMWCCVGTGMENHGKYGEMIYTQDGDALYVNLFVASELNWKEKGIRLTQYTDFPASGNSTITIQDVKSNRIKMLIRYPSWVPAGKMKVTVGGKDYAKSFQPGSYIVVDRVWKKGDQLKIDMPMDLRVEELKHNPEYISIFRGPILMGSKVDHGDVTGLVADDHRWGHIAHGSLVSLFDTPALIGDRAALIGSLNQTRAIANQPLHFQVPSAFVDKRFGQLTLQPFYEIHDSRYMMYWLAMTGEEFNKLQAEKKEEERLKLVLDQRTVDAVKLGEQQPEVDHRFKELKSSKGNHQGQSWREAADGGYFSFELQTSAKKNLSLLVTYWGYESGNRDFDVLIDDQVIATEKLGGKWNQSKFFDLNYAIPNDVLQGKDIVTVKFVPKPGHRAGRVFRVRLVE